MAVVTQQQGSRAGLITALVVSIIAALVCGIFWMQASTERDLARNDRKAEIEKYEGIIKDLTSGELEAAKAAGKAGDPPTGAFEHVVGQRDSVIKAMVGAVVKADEAVRQSGGALLAANKALADGIAADKQETAPANTRGLELPPSTPLINAIGTYVTAYLKVEQDKDAGRDALTALNAEVAALRTAHQTELTNRDQAIAMRDAEIAKVKAEVEGYRAAQTAALTGVQTDTGKQIEGYTAQITQKDALLASKETQIAGLGTKIANLERVLASYRQNTKENVIRESDGNITRIPGDGYCYINRGAGDQITVGMTFEVYDRIKGIPKLGDGGIGQGDESPADKRAAAAIAARTGGKVAGATYDNEMPRGKGSIEVISVGPGHTSQCRIVKVESGQVLNEGDLIGNLVYNPKNKFNWVVYGDFDLDNNGVPSTNDRSVIERLVVQWGGKLTPIADAANAAASITVDVDYIVMGMEPRVPKLDPENPPSAEEADRIARAQAAKAVYDAVLKRASELSIPVLNQNRFLYYTGFYDQRRR